MLVASIAGVASVIVVGVTGHAGCVVVFVENKELCVIECCGFPMRWNVALITVRRNLSVYFVVWTLVTPFAFVEYRFCQLCMVECGGLPMVERVALPACYGKVAMDIVGGSCMASFASLSDFGAKV